MSKAVSLREYGREVVNTARYLPCGNGSGFVAFVDALPGCMTQGNTIEDARDLLIDAVDTWILSAIKDGEALPVINECRLAVAEPAEALEPACG